MRVKETSMRFLLAFLVVAMSWEVCAYSQPFQVTYTFDNTSEKWANQSPIDENSLSEWSKTGGRTGGAVHMKASGANADQMRPWRKVIPNPPSGKRLAFSAWVKGVGVENVASVVVQAHSSNEGFSRFESVSTQTTQPLKGDFDWTRVQVALDVPTEAMNLQILLLLVGNGEVWFDDVEIKEDGNATAIAPGLFLARGKSKITTRVDADATRLMPIPMSYREQVPVTYSLTVEPPARFKSAKVYEDKPGNWVLSLTIAPPAEGAANEPVIVEWKSCVLVAPSSFDDVPVKAAYPAEWPDETKPWLTSTLCVQSADEKIKKVAEEIRGESNDVPHVIQAVLERTRQIYDKQSGRCMNLDAVNALEKQGSCTSCANLVAALLRATNIPARVLAGYPAWSGPLQTHYIVEAYIPSYGWYPIESTMLRAPWARHQQIQVSIVPPEYEDKSAMRPQIAGGVPYLSLDERAPDSAMFFTHGIVSSAHPYCDHEAVAMRNFPASTSKEEWNALLELARTRWSRWLTESGELKSPPRSGPEIVELESTTPEQLRKSLGQ